MIADRIAAVREKIARAAARAGREEGDVTLVAVSKTQGAEAVREAFAAGVRVFGENRVQEAEAKARALAELRAAGLRSHPFPGQREPRPQAGADRRRKRPDPAGSGAGRSGR